MKRIKRKNKNAVRILSLLAVAFVFTSFIATYMKINEPDVRLSPPGIPEVPRVPGVNLGPDVDVVTPFVVFFVLSLVIFFAMIISIVYIFMRE